MGHDELDENTVYKVIVNDDDQHSIWPEFREIPAGWREAGKTGSKQECLNYIDEKWIDMRPPNLRRNG